MPNRLFITGDTHRHLDTEKILTNFPVKDRLDRSDILVVLGDWGAIWFGDQRDSRWINWWSYFPWTTFVVFGNHDNYAALEKYPKVIKFGSVAYQITPFVYVACSGNIYDFNGKTCLCINGADSLDRDTRTEGLNWWKQEAITFADTTTAFYELEKHSYHIDYLFTHCGGAEVCASLGFTPTPSEEQLQKLIDLGPRQDTYLHYCGHYHLDKWVNANTRIVYNDILELT